MRIRVIFSGAASAAICLVALWFPWYMMEPSSLAPDWAFADEAAILPAWISTAVYIFCGLTVFVFGWVSARWNWANNWKSSLLAGAGAGLIAGCLVFDFIGAFHFGLLGQAEILKNFSRELTETEGLVLIVDAVTGTAFQMYMNFIYLVAASTTLGALGGLASAIDVDDKWGSPPWEPDSWLFRIPAYSLVVTGGLLLIFTIAAVSLLQESVTETVVNYELLDVKHYPFLLSFTIYLIGWVMIILPMCITWGWILRAWRTAGLWKVMYGIWLAASIGFGSWVTYGLVSMAFSFTVIIQTDEFPLLISVLVGVLTITSGLLIGFYSTAIADGNVKYRFSDWLGYILAQGILGGTQVFVSIPAYGVALALILIVNIPYITNTGIVEETPSEQIVLLSQILTYMAAGMVVISALFGWLFGLIVLLIRKFLKIQPVPSVQESLPDSFHPPSSLV